MSAGFGGVFFPLPTDGFPQSVVCLPPHVVRKGLEVPGGVGELEHPGDDEEEVLWSVGIGREDGELAKDKEPQRGTAHLLTSDEIQGKTAKATDQHSHTCCIYKHQRCFVICAHPGQEAEDGGAFIGGVGDVPKSQQPPSLPLAQALFHFFFGYPVPGLDEKAGVGMLGGRWGRELGV